MNRITLSLLLIFLLNFGYSQVPYSKYLDNTSEWRYYYGGFSGFSGFAYYTTIYFDGVETINGMTYYKEYRKFLDVEGGSFGGGPTSTLTLSGPQFVREDASGKFYRIDPNDGTEYVFFDNQQIIDAKIGDTFPDDNNTTCLVNTIETNYLGSTPLKWIKGSQTSTTDGSLEGVGRIGNTCSMGIEGNGWINCYSKQNINLQFGTIDCNSFPIPNRVNLGLESHNLMNNHSIIFPNPTNGIFKIKTPLANMNNSFEIYNSYGVKVKEGNINTEEQLIDISSFTSGVYVLKVFGYNLIEYDKIIKE